MQLASRLMRLPCGGSVSGIVLERGECEVGEKTYVGVAGRAAGSDVGTALLLDGDSD